MPKHYSHIRAGHSPGPMAAKTGCGDAAVDRGQRSGSRCGGGLWLSEAAFNRAFKREFDCPPAPFRRKRKADPGAGQTIVWMESKRFPHRFILLPCQILKTGAAGVPGCWLTRKICGLLEGVCALTKPLASPGGRRSANTMVTSTQHSGSTPEPHKATDALATGKSQ